MRLLASVTTPQEARLAMAGGADVIDAKDPARGALGALDSTTLRAIRAVVASNVPLSATTGDLPVDQPQSIINEVARVAATSVDIVKIGFFDLRPPHLSLRRWQPIMMKPMPLGAALPCFLPIAHPIGISLPGCLPPVSLV